MKRLHFFFAAVTLLSVVLASCTMPQRGESIATDAPVSQPPISSDATATTAPAPASPVPSVVVPIDVAGPPMEVGSKFPYVDGSILVAVPGGEFVMGYGGFDNPEHVVSVSDFWIYRAKVTNAMYALCVRLGQCGLPDLTKNKAYNDPLRANDPVVGVNWDQAQAYCSFVHGRLPTEAEWEKTARGPEGNIWPWGDSGPECNRLNYNFCIGKTTDVTEYPDGMSYFEALDMSGNALEWVADWYSAKYYGESPAEDPLGPELGQKRSVRGSSYGSGADDSISALRSSLKPIESRADLGFRCVVEDPTYFALWCQTAVQYGMDAKTGLPVGGPDPAVPPCDVSIQQVPLCKSGTTNIKFIGPPGSVIDPDGCDPTGNPDQYNCSATDAGPVSISAACNVTLVGDPSCPPGYSQEGNECVAKGSQGQCLPGANYDPNLQCCTALDGNGASIPLPICPPGTYFAQAMNACVSYPVASNDSDTQSIQRPGACNPANNQPECEPATDPACAPPPQACQPKGCQSWEKWCQSSCSCIYYYSPCP